MTTIGAGELRYGRALELKTANEGWEVAGYASTFGNRDLVGDVVLPGAFKRTLASSQPVRFLYSHQADQVLGTPITLEEDTKGLFGRFRISKTRLGEDVRQLLLDGALDSFSIGFIVRDSEPDRQAGVRRLKDIDLVECSVVSMPANPQAMVTQAKWAPPRSLVKEYLEHHVAGLRAKEARLQSRARFARMTPEEVRLQAAAMRLRLRLGLLGATQAGGR